MTYTIKPNSIVFILEKIKANSFISLIQKLYPSGFFTSNYEIISPLLWELHSKIITSRTLFISRKPTLLDHLELF